MRPYLDRKHICPALACTKLRFVVNHTIQINLEFSQHDLSTASTIDFAQQVKIDILETCQSVILKNTNQ